MSIKITLFSFQILSFAPERLKRMARCKFKSENACYLQSFMSIRCYSMDFDTFIKSTCVEVGKPESHRFDAFERKHHL